VARVGRQVVRKQCFFFLFARRVVAPKGSFLKHRPALLFPEIHRPKQVHRDNRIMSSSSGYRGTTATVKDRTSAPTANSSDRRGVIMSLDASKWLHPILMCAQTRYMINKAFHRQHNKSRPAIVHRCHCK